MDQFLFEEIYGLSGQSIYFDGPMIFFAKTLVFVLPISLLFFIVLTKNRRREITMLILTVAACLLSRGIIVSVIRLFWHRPRPFIALNLTPLIPYGDKASFPSGHAAFLFALALAVWFYHKKIGWLFLGLVLLASLARIYVGVHWPSDILVGAIIGLLSAILTNRIFRRYFLKKSKKTAF